MRAWQDELLNALADVHIDEHEIFERIKRAARALGFEHSAYGIRVPIPVTRPRVLVLSTYPDEWTKRYDEAGYLAVDPTVHHCATSQSPIVWSDDVFSTAPQLWSEARSQGLNVGLAHPSLDMHGVRGMLTLARSHDQLLPTEFETVVAKIAWLAHTAHVALSRRVVPDLAGGPTSDLTPREVEVLQWTADGKTAGEIGDILRISEHTATFHLGNAMRKLSTTSKTAAAVKATLLGLL